MMAAVLAVLLAAGCTSSSEEGNAVSAVVDGWNFTANLEGLWQSNSDAVAENNDWAGLNSRSMEYLNEHNMDADSPNFNNWKGSYFANVFYLPKEGTAIDPQNIHGVYAEQNDLVANVDIQVHKVPTDVKYWKPHDIFMDLSFVLKDDTVKDIEFNDRPALLVEHDYDEDEVNDEGKVIVPKSSICSILILITDDTVITIDAVTLPDSDMSAKDVIDSFTISPK